MITIIAGSRTITNYAELLLTIKCSGFKITQVVSGGARGVDKLGERYAHEHKLTLNTFLANWDKYGKSAGYIRNKQMAEFAEAAIILWDGKSKGTTHMYNLAKQYDLKIYFIGD